MKNFHNTYFLNASPKEVFNALTNPVTIEIWSGYPAKMDDKEDTEFYMWEGDISGKNLEIKKNKKIVQEWYFGDQPEKSIVTIEIKKEKHGTNVRISHTNIPDEAYENMKFGWNDLYFVNLKLFFDIS
jgi:activator of HSP90 ATPase